MFPEATVGGVGRSPRAAMADPGTRRSEQVGYLGIRRPSGLINPRCAHPPIAPQGLGSLLFSRSLLGVYPCHCLGTEDPVPLLLDQLVLARAVLGSQGYQVTDSGLVRGLIVHPT
jgi:hypothetical protein